MNDLFGFITNLTEIFKTKTVIITNQEFFKENDSEIFSRIKEKSVNKFLLLNPTIVELFETIYKEKYTDLDEYKSKILEAINITEEKNARIYTQVLNNCLEYKERAKDEHEIFMLVLITVMFVKYNLIFEMSIIKNGRIAEYLHTLANKIPAVVLNGLIRIKGHTKVKSQFFNTLRDVIEKKSENTKEENVKEYFKFIKQNQNMLFQIYKYCIQEEYFKEEDKELIERLNDFVESGILLDE